MTTRTIPARSCECCYAHSLNEMFNRFNPACLQCGARYIRMAPRWRRSEQEVTDLRRHVLKVWGQYGHREQELRDAAKNWTKTDAQSGGQAESEGSAGRKRGKRR